MTPGCSHTLATPGRTCPWCGAQIESAAAGSREVPGGHVRTRAADSAIVTAPVTAAAPHGLAAGTPPGLRATPGAVTPPQPSLFDDGAQDPSQPRERFMQYGSPAGSGLVEPARPQPERAGILHSSSPAARSTDPDTSHEAATRQRDRAAIYAQVLDLLATEPRTDFELAALTGLKQTSVGKRRGELRDLGLVVECGHGLSDTGSRCIRWALTEHGRMEVAA